MNFTSAEFDARLNALVAHGQRLNDEHFATHFKMLRPNKLAIEPGGRRYIKIISTNNGGDGQTSVWAFVDTSNGDILKPESWKKPAKHARGNLFDADRGLGNITYQGPLYMDAMPKAS